MAAARTAMTAAPHMPKKFWSHAVLDAAEKGNYLSTTKNGQMQASPHTRIQQSRPDYCIVSPATLLPWGKVGRTVNAEKFKKKLEDRGQKACYLRRLGADKYQIWLPESNKITSIDALISSFSKETKALQ